MCVGVIEVQTRKSAEMRSSTPGSQSSRLHFSPLWGTPGYCSSTMVWSIAGARAPDDRAIHKCLLTVSGNHVRFYLPIFAGGGSPYHIAYMCTKHAASPCRSPGCLLLPMLAHATWHISFRSIGDNSPPEEHTSHTHCEVHGSVPPFPSLEYHSTSRGQAGSCGCPAAS